MPAEIESLETEEAKRLYEIPKFISESEVWHWIDNGLVGHFQAEVWTEKGGVPSTSSLGQP